MSIFADDNSFNNITMNKHLTFLSALAIAAGLNLNAQNANRLTVQTNKIGAEIQPTMYGHFFEDINFGADGGLYALRTEDPRS